MPALDFAEANELVRFRLLDVSLARLAAVVILAAIVSDTVHSNASFRDFEAAGFDTMGVVAALAEAAVTENLAFRRVETRYEFFEQIALRSDLTVCIVDVVCYGKRPMEVSAGLGECHWYEDFGPNSVERASEAVGEGYLRKRFDSFVVCGQELVEARLVEVVEGEEEVARVLSVAMDEVVAL